MASVTAVPTAGTHESTVFKFTCAATPSNNTSGFDSTKYPTEPQITYQFVATGSGVPTLTSHVFSTSSASAAEWDGVIFPAPSPNTATTWTITLTKVSDSSSVATTTVVIS